MGLTLHRGFESRPLRSPPSPHPITDPISARVTTASSAVISRTILSSSTSRSTLATVGSLNGSASAGSQMLVTTFLPKEPLQPRTLPRKRPVSLLTRERGQETSLARSGLLREAPATAQIRASGADYELGRRLLTAEVNAAIDGAAGAGATQTLVNDCHSTMQSLDPGALHHDASYLSGGTSPCT